MNALTIYEAATADGLVVDLSPTGNLKVVGEERAVAKWTPTLKQHKAEIVDFLSKRTSACPSWCRADCHGLETIDLPGQGSTLGCVHPVLNSRRLDMLTKCPAMEKSIAQPLPEWCSTRCEHFHQLTVPAAGVLRWCCREEDETHWRLDRIDSMTECPLEQGRK